MTLSTLVPLSGLPSVGFAFQSYDQVWAAMDGGVGDLVREAIGKAGVVPMKRMWDNGFRQITSSSSRQLNNVEYLKGFKIRVPVTALLTSLFSVLGALQRALLGPADPYRRGSGEPARAGVDRQALRGAKILRAEQPLLEWLLGQRQPACAGKLAGGSACDRQRKLRR